MIGIYNSITVLTMLPSGESLIVPISKKTSDILLCWLPGGDMALKQPSFAIVNDVANIASQLPRAPDEELIMLLQRPGATSTYKKTFRPYKIK